MLGRCAELVVPDPLHGRRGRSRLTPSRRRLDRQQRLLVGEQAPLHPRRVVVRVRPAGTRRRPGWGEPCIGYRKVAVAVGCYPAGHHQIGDRPTRRCRNRRFVGPGEGAAANRPWCRASAARESSRPAERPPAPSYVSRCRRHRMRRRRQRQRPLRLPQVRLPSPRNRPANRCSARRSPRRSR